MIQPVNGSRIEQFSQTPRPTTDAREDKSPPADAVDFKVSFNREIVSTLTYERTGMVKDVASQADEAPGFEELLSRLLERQGITFEEAQGGKTVAIDPETRAEAQALISEDGYWGVEKTSARIVEFAIAGAGGDTTRLEEIKAAIDNGFGMAAETLGGSLPEISTKTYDAVMEKLDQWAGKQTDVSS